MVGLHREIWEIPSPTVQFNILSRESSSHHTSSVRRAAAVTASLAGVSAEYPESESLREEMSDKPN